MAPGPFKPTGSGTDTGSTDIRKPTVAFAHLGCEKNRVDTEHMLGLLAEAGYGVSADESEANLVVVNTCSFIQEARQESVRTLVELAEQGKELIISGCLAQHFQEELLDSLPEAKAIVGTGDYQHIVSVLERVQAGERVNQVSPVPTFVADEHLPRYRTTSEAVAYLKVAEGCDYRCAFCIIPKLRGDQRSRPIESIVAEAQQLAAQGVQPWSDLPVWLPATGDSTAFAATPVQRALAQGLAIRPLADTVRDTLRWHQGRPLAEREKLKAGIDAAREQAVLTAWRRRGAIAEG